MRPHPSLDSPPRTREHLKTGPYRFVRAVVQVSSIDARALVVILGDLVRDGVVPAPVERLDLNQLRRVLPDRSVLVSAQRLDLIPRLRSATRFLRPVRYLDGVDSTPWPRGFNFGRNSSPWSPASYVTRQLESHHARLCRDIPWELGPWTGWAQDRGLARPLPEPAITGHLHPRRCYQNRPFCYHTGPRPGNRDHPGYARAGVFGRQCSVRSRLAVREPSQSRNTSMSNPSGEFR